MRADLREGRPRVRGTGSWPGGLAWRTRCSGPALQSSGRCSKFRIPRRPTPGPGVALPPLRAGERQHARLSRGPRGRVRAPGRRSLRECGRVPPRLAGGARRIRSEAGRGELGRLGSRVPGVPGRGRVSGRCCGGSSGVREWGRVSRALLEHWTNHLYELRSDTNVPEAPEQRGPRVQARVRVGPSGL